MSVLLFVFIILFVSTPQSEYISRDNSNGQLLQYIIASYTTDYTARFAHPHHSTMLPRAARQSHAVNLRPWSQHVNLLSPQPLRQTILCTSLQTRQASSSRRPPPPPPASSRPSKVPPPPRPFQGATGQPKQTSPGTSVGRDQTWKPQDGVKFGAAAGQTAPNAVKTPISGSRPADGAAVGRDSPLAEAAQDPIASIKDAIADATQNLKTIKNIKHNVMTAARLVDLAATILSRDPIAMFEAAKSLQTSLRRPASEPT